jgi:hypothetical protein
MLDTLTNSFQHSPVFWSAALVPSFLLPVLFILFGDNLRNLIKVYVLPGQANEALKTPGAAGGMMSSLQ